MSNDMISVPRELLERLERIYMDGMSIYGECEEIRALLAQPNTCTKDGGQCGLGGFCDTCHNVEPVLPRCTCPSGDGSLRWPCPVHPASETHVEMRLRHKREFNALCGDGFHYQECSCGTSGSYPEEIKWCVCGKAFASAEPQSPAQAPAVLPGRKTYLDYEQRGRRHERAEEWNACIDEFKRLNPGITEAAPPRKS